MFRIGFKNVLAVVFLLLPLLSCASAGTSLDKILAEKEAPAGVVIEIVTGDGEALSWALPLSKKYIAALRKKFPGLPVAIVTHGREQFALQKNKNNSQKKIHSLTQSLKKENVPLHVCGTYAGWKGLTEEMMTSTMRLVFSSMTERMIMVP